MTADGKLITGAGKAHDSGWGGFLCAFRFFLFFMKAILSFFDFWTIFCCCFFSFLFCFDLPHVSNCYESDSFIFLIFGPFLLFFILLFIFALTFHKCQIVKKAILSF